MRRKEKGTALIIAMVMVVMIAGMSVALLNLGMTRSKAADFRMDEFRTFQIAQSAVARARAMIDGQEYTEGDSFDDLVTQVSFGNDFIDDRYASGESLFPGTASAGEYFATVTKLSGNLYRIRAGGRRPGRVEDMEFVAGVEEMVRVTPPSLNPTVTPFSNSGAAKSKGTLTMTGGTTDSYNSDDGAYDPSSAGSEGNVSSNTNVILGEPPPEDPLETAGSATVNGTASASGTVTVYDGSTASGGTLDGVAETDMPSVKDIGPDIIDPANNDNASLDPAVIIGADTDFGNSDEYILATGTYYFGAVEVKNKTLTIKTPCKVYMSGPLNVWPSGDIIIDTSGGGSVEFYLAAGADVKGAMSAPTADPLKPSDFQIYSHGTGDITIKTPHALSCMSVYAPEADITLQANAVIYGAIVGGTVTVKSGQTEIHYDTALAGVSVEVEVPEDQTLTWVVSPPDDTDPALVWRQIPVVRPPVAE